MPFIVAWKKALNQTHYTVFWFDDFITIDWNLEEMTINVNMLTINVIM